VDRIPQRPLASGSPPPRLNHVRRCGTF
jgi:hypothetical protein